MITPLLSLTFVDTRNVLKHRRVPLRNLLVLWDKKFLTVSRDNASPTSSIRFYHTRSFLKLERDPLRNFSVIWDKIKSTENLDTLLLSLSFLDIRIFLKNRNVLYEVFRTCETTVFWRELAILHPSSLLPSHMQKKVVDTKFFPKAGRFRLRIY